MQCLWRDSVTLISTLLLTYLQTIKKYLIEGFAGIQECAMNFTIIIHKNVSQIQWQWKEHGYTTSLFF